jgi:hypothetical protein
MPETPNRPSNGESVGENIAAEMLKNIVRLNDNIEKSHKIYGQLAESVAALADYHESYMRAMEILVEQSDEGKSKFTLGDLAAAMAEAAAEVMPDDGEGEDEPGPEDPRIGAER